MPNKPCIEWRVAYSDGWNTFNTDPQLDGLRALAAFAEECAHGNAPKLLCRIDGGDWLPRATAEGYVDGFKAGHLAGYNLAEQEAESAQQAPA